MSAHECRATLEEAPLYERALRLDEAFPNCACETWALTAVDTPHMADIERFARVLTAPDAYEEATSTILTGKLTQIYSMGMSIIRQGASDSEIIDTINSLLTGGNEPRHLVGAIVASVTFIRSFANDETASRWFGIYATDDRGKRHHGDVLGTTVSKSQQQKRRHKLASDMRAFIVEAVDTTELILRLRNAGI